MIISAFIEKYKIYFFGNRTDCVPCTQLPSEPVRLVRAVHRALAAAVEQVARADQHRDHRIPDTGAEEEEGSTKRKASTTN